MMFICFLTITLKLPQSVMFHSHFQFFLPFYINIFRVSGVFYAWDIMERRATYGIMNRIMLEAKCTFLKYTHIFTFQTHYTSGRQIKDNFKCTFRGHTLCFSLTETAIHDYFNHGIRFPIRSLMLKCNFSLSIIRWRTPWPVTNMYWPFY